MWKSNKSANSFFNFTDSCLIFVYTVTCSTHVFNLHVTVFFYSAILLYYSLHTSYTVLVHCTCTTCKCLHTHTQLHYSLGSHYFWRDNFKRAHSCFKQSRLCLASLSSCPPVVDAAQLHGFVRACQVMRAKVRRKTDVTVGTGGEATLLWEEEKSEPEKDGDEEEEEEDDGGDEEKTLLDRLERCRVSDPEVWLFLIEIVFLLCCTCTYMYI